MKSEILKKKLEILERQKFRCDTLKSQEVKCPYCDAYTNLLIIKNQHWKSKKCLKMKELYLINKPDDKPSEFDILLKLNKKINEVSMGQTYDDNITNDDNK